MVVNGTSVFVFFEVSAGGPIRGDWAADAIEITRGKRSSGDVKWEEERKRIFRVNRFLVFLRFLRARNSKVAREPL